MGGCGSGRYRYSGGKNTTDDYYSIDVRRWKRDGCGSFETTPSDQQS